MGATKSLVVLNKQLDFKVPPSMQMTWILCYICIIKWCVPRWNQPACISHHGQSILNSIWPHVLCTMEKFHLRKCTGLVWVWKGLVHVFSQILQVQACGLVGDLLHLIQNLPDTSSHFLAWQISQKWLQLCWHSNDFGSRFWPEYWLDSRFYRFVVSQTGNNQPIPETANREKTSLNIYSISNQYQKPIHSTGATATRKF